MLEIISENVDDKINKTFLLPAISSCKILNSNLSDISDSIYLSENKFLRLIHCDFNIRSVLLDAMEIVKS